jgi:hypothetical protein
VSINKIGHHNTGYYKPNTKKGEATQKSTSNKNTGISEPNASTKSQGEDKVVVSQNTSDTIQISHEALIAMRKEMAANMNAQGNPLNFQMGNMSSLNLAQLRETHLTLPSREQLHAESYARQAELAELDPFDNEFQINNVKWIPAPIHTFENQAAYTREGSYHLELLKMLDGKARNASMVTSELVHSLKSSMFNKDLSLAQRAEIREAAYRSAQYIADNYFDNPNEAKAFMDLITKIRDEDIMREKGYVFPRSTIYVDGVIEVNTMEPFRNYSSPGRGNDYISPVGTARFLGAPEEMLQRGQFFADGTSDIINFITSAVAGKSFSSESSAVSWDAGLRQGILDAWYANEREATAIINQITANFDTEFGERFLQRILKAF